MYDDIISNNCFKVLEWAFIFNILISFWMFSSNHLFANNSFEPTWVGGFNGGHSLLSFVIPNAGWPLLIGIIIFIVVYIWPIIINWWSPKKKEFESDELERYSKVLSLYDKNWLVTEERNMR